MTENMNEENNNFEQQNEQQNEQQPTKKPHWSDGNQHTLKFLAICLSAFVGGFVAMFAINGITMFSQPHPIPPRPLPPHHKILPPIENSTNFGRDNVFVPAFEFENPEMRPQITKHKPNKMKHIINIEEGAQNYKIDVDLSKFNNDEKNVEVKVKPHSIKISGTASVKNDYEQSSFSYFQELPLERKVNVNKVTKEKIGNRYVITLPTVE